MRFKRYWRFGFLQQSHLWGSLATRMFTLNIQLPVLFLSTTSVATAAPLNNMNIYDGSISHGLFAITDSRDKGEAGANVFVGNMDGIVKTKIHSDHYVWSPFIVDMSKILLVEAIEGPNITFGDIILYVPKQKP